MDIKKAKTNAKAKTKTNIFSLRALSLCFILFLFLSITACTNQSEQTNTENPSQASSSISEDATSLIPNQTEEAATTQNTNLASQNENSAIAKPAQSQTNEKGNNLPQTSNQQTVAPASQTNEKGTNKVEISITDDDGTAIFEKTAIDMEKDDTALTVLIRIGKNNNIPVVFSGSKKNAYVEGIDNLFEFDKGQESGWIYKVNGEVPMMSAGSYELKPNDIIQWIYIIKLEEGLK